VSLDPRAVRVGALAAIAAALPAQVLGGLLDIAAFALVVLFAFVIGGTVAALKRPDAPYTHGIVAAAAACVVTSGISVAIRLAKGDDLQPAAYAFNLVLAAGCGSLGGLIVERRGPAA